MNVYGSVSESERESVWESERVWVCVCKSIVAALDKKLNSFD